MLIFIFIIEINYKLPGVSQIQQERIIPECAFWGVYFLYSIRKCLLLL